MSQQTTTKFTPGPWKVIPPGHGHPSEYQCVQIGADENYATLEMLPADARLIAAAPEMLDSLKGLLRIIAAMRISVGLGSNQLDRVNKANAVVAKAEGRLP